MSDVGASTERIPHHDAMENARHWTLAVLVVLSGLTVGAATGAEIGHPLLGALGGVALGLGANYGRGCPPCRRHAAEMRAALAQSRQPPPPPPTCSTCARARARALARAQQQTG